MKTKYLNTDLDLISSTPMDDLIAHFETVEDLSVLIYQQGSDGNWFSTLESEIEGEWVESDVEGEMVEPIRAPEKHIRLMLESILSLPEKLKEQWQSCEKRDFNIGYDFGETRCFQQGLSAELVEQIAEVGGTISWTLYYHEEGDSG